MNRWEESSIRNEVSSPVCIRWWSLQCTLSGGLLGFCGWVSRFWSRSCPGVKLFWTRYNASKFDQDSWTWSSYATPLVRPAYQVLCFRHDLAKLRQTRIAELESILDEALRTFKMQLIHQSQIPSTIRQFDKFAEILKVQVFFNESWCLPVLLYL